MDEPYTTKPSYFDMKYKYTTTPGINWLAYQKLQDGYGGSENSLFSATTSYLTNDPLEHVLEDKKTLLRSKMEMLLAGVTERRKIKNSNISRIDIDYCDVVTMIMQMHPYKRYGFDRDRINLEKMKKDLEGQKRMEEVNYFRDLSFLNRDLIHTALEYMSEHQKEHLINTLED
jgi:hypothetical protein